MDIDAIPENTSDVMDELVEFGTFSHTLSVDFLDLRLKRN